MCVCLCSMYLVSLHIAYINIYTNIQASRGANRAHVVRTSVCNKAAVKRSEFSMGGVAAGYGGEATAVRKGFTASRAAATCPTRYFGLDQTH